MTRITTNIIATATPPIPPAIGPILDVGGSGGGRFTKIKIKKICSLSLLQKYITLIMYYIRNYNNCVTTNRLMQCILRRMCQVKKVCSQVYVA